MAIRQGAASGRAQFGDCFTYARADRTGHPVLYTGDDFAGTDITVVRPGTELSGQPV
jgi:ribonuclease VapC